MKKKRRISKKRIVILTTILIFILVVSSCIYYEMFCDEDKKNISITATKIVLNENEESCKIIKYNIQTIYKVNG